MRNKRVLLAATAVIGALALSGLSVVSQQQGEEPPPMGFFITALVSVTALTLVGWTARTPIARRWPPRRARATAPGVRT